MIIQHSIDLLTQLHELEKVISQLEDWAQAKGISLDSDEILQTLIRVRLQTLTNRHSLT